MRRLRPLSLEYKGMPVYVQASDPRTSNFELHDLCVDAGSLQHRSDLTESCSMRFTK